jgi:hypothetical protein
MPLSNTYSGSFYITGFTKNKPDYVITDNTTTGKKFATDTIVFSGGTTNHSYVRFDITYTGNADISMVSFGLDKGDQISYSLNEQGPYEPFYSADPIFGLNRITHSGRSIELARGVQKTIYSMYNA